jgi:hypothetical protein
VRILQSPRWRRRLFFLAIPVGIAPFIYLGVHYSNPGNPGGATGPGGYAYVEPKPAPFKAADRRAVRPVLKEFIRTAVARKDVSRSWDLAAPSLRQGVTRRQWNRGNLPVVPYPAANRGLGTWSFVEYSYTDTVGLEVFLFPQPHSGYSALTADVELVKAKNGRWQVDYWMPKSFHGPPSLAANVQKSKRVQKKPNRSVRTAAPRVVITPRVGLWWAFPVALLSLFLLVPITIALVAWYQNRKAKRDYLRSAQRG